MALPIGAHCDERAAVRQPIGRHDLIGKFPNATTSQGHLRERAVLDQDRKVPGAGDRLRHARRQRQRQRFAGVDAHREDLARLAIPGGRVDHALAIGRESCRVDEPAAERELSQRRLRRRGATPADTVRQYSGNGRRCQCRHPNRQETAAPRGLNCRHDGRLQDPVANPAKLLSDIVRRLQPCVGILCQAGANHCIERLRSNRLNRGRRWRLVAREWRR